MIEFREVSKYYGDFRALDGINLTVSDGSVCVLIGPSGCGKSTTLRLINRMIDPSKGEILVDGRPVGDRRAEELRRTIGYVIQSVGLLPHMSVEENIGIVPNLLGWQKSRTADRAHELLTLVGLSPEQYATKFPHQLSGGEAQRVGVARALAADPPILLMDEPFGAVDPLNREVLQGEFINIQRKLKKTVVFVTHDLDEAIRVADVVVLMQSGSIVQVDSPEDILAHPKNRFVRNFVGADRALKRLSRFVVRDYMRDAPSLDLDDCLDESNHAALLKTRFFWVVDRPGFLKGWIDLKGAEPNVAFREQMSTVRPVDVGINQLASMKDALSRMMGQGIKDVPVLDNQWKLVGVVSLKDVEGITEQGDFSL